jgi:hypothetical protein
MSKTILAQMPPGDENAAILAIVNPPTGCPACYAERGEPFPPNYSTRICAPHAAAMRLMSEARKTEGRSLLPVRHS